MSIVYKLPKNARYIPSNNNFNAVFGTPSIALYNFGIAANQNQAVIELQPSTVYFLDYFQIAGNIPSETFLSVINTQPLLTFRKKLGGEIMFTGDIPISVFAAQIYIGAFLHSQKAGDALTVSFNGILNQNVDLIGVSPVTINLKLSIFAMDEGSYNRTFADREFTK